MNNLALILIIVVVAIFLAYAFSSVIHTKREDTHDWKKKARMQLSQLKTMGKNTDATMLQYVLVDADKLLDFCLQNKKVRGKTLGERLRNSRDLFDRSMYNRLWEAHTLRNRIAHEVGVRVSTKDVQAALETLESAIYLLSK